MITTSLVTNASLWQRRDQTHECEQVPSHLLRPLGCSSIFMSSSQWISRNNWSKNEKDIILGWDISNDVKVLLDIESFTFKTFFFWNSLKEYKWQFSLKYQTFNIAEAKSILQGEIEYFLGKLWIIILLKESSYSHFTFLVCVLAFNCMLLFMHRNEEKSWQLSVLVHICQWPKSIVQHPLINRFYLFWENFKSLLILHHLHSDFLFIPFSILTMSPPTQECWHKS